jgi:hypothetical protein
VAFSKAFTKGAPQSRLSNYIPRRLRRRIYGLLVESASWVCQVTSYALEKQSLYMVI